MDKKTSLVISVVVIFVALLLFGGCNAGQTSEEQPNGQDTASEIEWSSDLSCDTCHKSQAENHTTFHSNLVCENCHSNANELEAVHSGKTNKDRQPTRLKNTVVSEASCESCHEEYDELTKKTEALVDLTDEEGTTVNPHEIKLHGGEQHQALTCADCHAEHKEDQPADQAKKLCLSCHHENVYKCGTCHASI